MHANQIARNVVVDRERKSSRKRTMIAEDNRMHPPEVQQGINVGEKAIEEMRSYSRIQPFVEPEALKSLSS